MQLNDEEKNDIIHAVENAMDRMQRSREEEPEWKGNLRAVRCYLDIGIENTRECIESLKGDGLTVNAIEAEGGLRALLDFRDRVEERFEGLD